MIKTTTIEYLCELCGTCKYSSKCPQLVIIIKDMPGKIDLKEITCHCDLKQYNVTFIRHKCTTVECD